MAETATGILSIDIGGSHIKVALLNEQGEFLKPYEKEDTPQPASPERVMSVIRDLAGKVPGFQMITAGFPGFVKDGVVKTAPKLGTELWKEYNLQQQLADSFQLPARVINDADLQGLSLASGKGLEMVITLGTGFGSSLLKEGVLLPHIEMSRLPITKRKNYNDYVGEEALEKIGKKRWIKRMKRVIAILEEVFNFDHLYISGGNARLLNFPLNNRISIENNKDGIKGGSVLWKTDGFSDPAASVSQVKKNDL